MYNLKEWQNIPLDNLSPIVYLERIVIRMRQDNRVMNKAVFLKLAVNFDG